MTETDRFFMKEAKVRSIIIPVHMRENYFETIQSIICAKLFHEIIIVTDERTTKQIHHSKIIRYHYINEENNGFCKSRYLNEGLKEAQGDYILLCDADIIWSSSGLRSMLAPVDVYNADFVYLNHVTENSPNNHVEANFIALHADVEHRNGEPTVRISVREQNASRPGYGIIYGKRQNFFALGGYKRLGRGTWGWEDLDFIIRLKIFSFNLMSAGHAKHLTHSDRYRSLNDIDKGQSRNENARQSLCEITWGQLMGDLGNRQERTDHRPSIEFQNGIDQLFDIQSV